MNGRSVLSVSLEDVDGRVVTDADLELVRAGATASERVPLDERNALFVSEPVEAGDYVLIVRASGYVTEEVRLRIEPPGVSTSVILGREGQPYYVTGGRRIYFEPEGEMGALMQRRGGEEPTRSAQEAMRVLGIAPEAAQESREPRIVTFPRETVAKAQAEMPERTMLELPDLLDMGPVIHSRAGDVQFLSRFIDVIAEEGVTWARLEEAVRPFGVHVFSQHRLHPTLFRLESDDVPGPELGALPEKLVELPEVREASSSIVVIDRNAALTPSDALFPLQYHAIITRCPDAWEKVDPAKNAKSLGSADIVIAVSDDGIATTTAAGVSVANHPAFSGTVVGGTLAATLTGKKLLDAFDFRVSPMVRGNDVPWSVHGSWVAGVVSASYDAVGVTGIAANTRLSSYLRVVTTASPQSADALTYYAGLDPGWVRGTVYLVGEMFPFLLGSGGRNVPGAAIVNASHVQLSAIIPQIRIALRRMTLFGRDRRGVLLFAAAGNEDGDARVDGRWAENVNVLRVAASSVDVQDNEVRMSHSSFSLVGDEILDFCAPSESDPIFPAIHQPPQVYGFMTTDQTDMGTRLQGSAGGTATLTNAPGAGTRMLRSGGFGPFLVGETVIVRDKTNPLHAEIHVIASKPAADTINTTIDLGFTYGPGAGEVIRITGTTAYDWRFGGTSAATPQASAIAALMLSVNPSLSWLEVRELMRATAVPIALRCRGSNGTAIPFPYRWRDGLGAAANNLIDANGLLTITGAPDRTIAAADGPLNRGTRVIKLDDTTGIAARQALLIGAETKLNGVHPIVPATEIEVDRTDGFETGDEIFIGKDVRTVVVRAAPMGALVLWVQSVDGIDLMDFITVGVQTVQVTGIQRMSTSGLVANVDRSGDAETGLTLAAGLTAAHVRGAQVRIASTQFQGPLRVLGKTATRLMLDIAVTAHPDDRIVWKRGTEVRAVIHVLPGNRVEIDPLQNAHPFNSAMVENVRIGRIAAYSLGFGRGRLDANEAVEAAKSYTHDERDLMIRNSLADDGKMVKRATGEVESPDLWVRNDAPSPAIAYADAPPHQTPEITVDPAIHVGTGRNDLRVSGVCTSAAEVTFVIEIDHTDPAGDTLKWTRNGVASGAGVAITPAAAQLLADGVSIRFAMNTGHMLTDRWIIRARNVVNRHLHIRVANRGSEAFFTRSTLTPATSPPPALEVAGSRLLLCVSDGYPVCRFASIAAVPGNNDIQVTSKYTGANARALYALEITTVGAADKFTWYRDGVMKTIITIAAGTDLFLDDGVKVQFDAATGHVLGDRWYLYARSGDDAFLNIDHYWEMNSAPTEFTPASGRAGTRVMTVATVHSISGLAAGADQVNTVTWPEHLRPPTNSPNAAKAAHPRRFFLLGEVVPHDGALNGFTAKTNNNITFREIAFAKFRFTRDAGAVPLQEQIDVDNTGIQTTQAFRVEVRTTAGTFRAEKVRLKFTAKKGAAPSEMRTFRHTGAWGLDAPAPWIVVSPPKAALGPAGGAPANATGEEFDIYFDCTLTVDRSFTELSVEAQIVSEFRDHAVATATHTIVIYQIAPLPLGTGAAKAAQQPKPSSFLFAAGLPAQTEQQAFGPVVDPMDADSLTTRYRVTSRFRAAAAVKAYAVTRGTVAIQRDPANNETVNLILRPLRQPIAGFTPVRYFIYRGLRLTDFLKGAAGADAKLMRLQAGASPFMTQYWTSFLAQNPGVTDIPSTHFGYDPDTQTANDLLDDVFFKVGGKIQLPIAAQGIELGEFHHTAAEDFGFEVVVEEGDYAATLGYARGAFYEVDLNTFPGGDAAQNFAQRLKKEEILNFIDPAAFYGLHMHTGGEVEAPAGVKHIGQAVYTNVVSTFWTRNKLYLDIRSENGASLNFQRNYDDGNGNQVQTGADVGAVAARPYATEGWPIVILDRSVAVNTPDDYHQLFLQLARNDNLNPVLHVEHGQLLTPSTNGAFLRDAQLNTATPWTVTARFRFPNTGPAGARIGVAWILRLHYGRMEVAVQNVPIPPTVLRTTKYLDNVFGPIDRSPKWKGTAAIKWLPTQDNRYVDANSTLGWRQMMQCGLARQSGGTARVLLYAIATDRDLEQNAAFPVEFAPVRGIPSGVGRTKTFFSEPGLFGVYLLQYDQTHDGANTVRTLQLLQDPKDGYAPSSALLLGLTQAEFDTLAALGATMSKTAPRTLLLDMKTAIADANRPADRYRVGVQGLKTADGEYESVFPGASIHVYTVDGQLFASKAFADAEPLPTTYARNYEEEKGARNWPQRERRIASANTGLHTITIAAYDWRSEVVVGGKIRIANATAGNGEYNVDAVALAGADTVITISGGPGPSGASLGSAFTIARAVEDRMIDLDQAPAVLTIPKTRTLVNGFTTALTGIANNAAAKGSIQTRIDDQGFKILRRARELARTDRAHSEDHERVLYWARLRMIVAIKSHPYCLRSIAARNELVNRLEEKSRGHDVNFAGAPGGARKVLIIGFDPFGLERNLEQSNPSASVALALHGTTLVSGAKNAYIESVIFPVRYRDFDAGRVEALVSPKLRGAGRVDMIMTINLDAEHREYDLERFAGRRRGGFYDNERVTQRPQALGVDATHAEFYETTLPPAVVIPGPFRTPPDDEQRLFFDQSYETDAPATYPRASDPGAPPGGNANAPAFALAGIMGKAKKGSGGDSLSNEIFYRIAQQREQMPVSTTVTGHFHIPSPAAAKVGIADVIAEVESVITRWLASVP